MIELNGRTALVTGASRGIGRACALRLASLGATVVVNFLQSQDAASETVREIVRLGGRAIAVRADVGNRNDVEAMMQVIQQRFGQLDILVSNAAAGGFRPLMNLTQANFEAVLRTNTLPLVWLTQSALPLMQKSTGNAKVIAVSSHGSIRAVPNYGAIGSSKAALESLVRHLALELGRSGINFNTVLSGIVATDAVRSMPGVEDILLAVKKGVLVPERDLLPEDVAGTIAFLASSHSDMIQGQTIIVDGGVSVRV